MRRPLTVPQPNLRQPLVFAEVDGFQGGFCATMEVRRCSYGVQDFPRYIVMLLMFTT
jgi:hypothetical protein